MLRVLTAGYSGETPTSRDADPVVAEGGSSGQTCAPLTLGTSCDYLSSVVQLPQEGQLGDSQDKQQGFQCSCAQWFLHLFTDEPNLVNGSHGAQCHGSSHVPLGSIPDAVPFSSKLGYAPAFRLCIPFPIPSSPAMNSPRKILSLKTLACFQAYEYQPEGAG